MVPADSLCSWHTTLHTYVDSCLVAPWRIFGNDFFRIATKDHCSRKGTKCLHQSVSSNLINIFTGSQSWNRQHHGQTIHPTEKLTSMNLYTILYAVTWAWLLFDFHVRDQKRYSKRTQQSVHPTVPVLLTKINKK